VKRFPVLAVVIAAALIAAFVLVLERMDRKPVDSDRRRESKKERPKGAFTGTPSNPRMKPTLPVISSTGRSVVIIIDDIGYDMRIAEELARIPEPIALAVLPNTPYAEEAARLSHAAGKEILLHLPMEPRYRPGETPGSGMLKVDMDAEEIRHQIRKDLAAVPFVSGVNNHMGSRFMEDEQSLFVIMEELRSRDLFFVDSMTTDDSRGRDAAARAHVRFAARDVFIDHAPGYAVALKSLTTTLRERRNNGSPVLMIGHPYRETVQAIHDVLPLWQKEGIKVISVSAYLRILGEAEKKSPFVKKAEMNPPLKESVK
jgi:uncharacterized protein